MTRIIRVFPRRTSATPRDSLAYVGLPDFWAEADRVEISVTFSWDLPRAERLAKEWERIAPVTIGGPAIERPQGPFVAGRYLRPGYVITSRGCPNRCWFCRVWRQSPAIEELPVTDGWLVQDDNLLACSQSHVQGVFEMLARQPERVEFTGGLEAARLADWHVDLLQGLRPQPAVWFACDTPDDYAALETAVAKLILAGFSVRGHRLRCYVLIGHPSDTFGAAEWRLKRVLALGLVPMAMLWHPESGETSPEWRGLQRIWARPAIISAMARST